MNMNQTSVTNINNKQIILPQQQLETKQDMQNLMRMLPMKNCQSVLKEFKATLAVLKDTKTHSWQKRTQSIDNIKMSFFMIQEYIQSQEDLVRHFKEMCPELFAPKQDISAAYTTPNVYSKSQLGGFNSKIKRLTKSPSQLSPCIGTDKLSNPSRHSPLPHPIQNITHGLILDSYQQALRPLEMVGFQVVSCMMRCVWPVLMRQLSDMRTSVAKEACALIVWLAVTYPQEFCRVTYKCQVASASQGAAQSQVSILQKNGGQMGQQQGQAPMVMGGANGVRLFKEDALPKLISSGNKLLQEMGHQCMLEIINNTPPIQNIAAHLVPLINSKNNQLRLRVAQYFEIILTAAVNNVLAGEGREAKAGTFESVEYNSQLFDFFLIKATDDQMQEVRNYGRFCFQQYRKLMPEQSTVLLMVGIEKLQIRKQIIQELGLDPIKLNQELQGIEISQQQLQQKLEDRKQAARSRASINCAEDNYQIASCFQSQLQQTPITTNRQKQKTPIRETVQKKMTQFDSAKTPEQFLRAMRSLKSPSARATCSRSPMVTRTQRYTPVPQMSCNNNQNVAYGGGGHIQDNLMSGVPSRDHSPIEDPNVVAFNANHALQSVRRYQVLSSGINVPQSPNRITSKHTFDEKVSQKTPAKPLGRFIETNLKKQLTSDRSAKRLETKKIPDHSSNTSPLVSRRNENNKSFTRLPLGQKMSRIGSKSQIQLQNGGSHYQKTLSRNYQLNYDRSKGQNNGSKADYVKQTQQNVFNQKQTLDISEGILDNVIDERSNKNLSGFNYQDQVNQQEVFSNNNVNCSHISQFRKTISPLNCGQSKSFMTKKERVLVSTQSQSNLTGINNQYNKNLQPKKVKTEVQTPNLTLSHQRSNSVSQMNQVINVSSRFQNLKKRYSEGKREDSLNGISTDGKSAKAVNHYKNEQWANNYDDNVDILQNTPTNNQISKQHCPKIQTSHCNIQQKEQLIVNLTGLKSFNKNQTQQKTSRIPQISQPNQMITKQQFAAARRIKVDLGYQNHPKSQYQVLSPRQTLPQQSKKLNNEATQNLLANERLSEAKRQQIQRKNYHAYFDMYKSSSVSAHKESTSAQENEKNQYKAQLSSTNNAVITMPTASTPISSINDQKQDIYENNQGVIAEQLLNKEQFYDSNSKKTSQIHDFVQFDTFSRKSVSKTTEQCDTNNNINSNTKNLEHEFNNFIHQENLSIQSKDAKSDMNQNQPFNSELGGYQRGNLDGQLSNKKSKYLQQMAANEYINGVNKNNALRERQNRVYSYLDHNQNANFQSNITLSQNDAQNPGDFEKVTESKFTSSCCNNEQVLENRHSMSSGLSISKNEYQPLKDPASFSGSKRQPVTRQESKMNSHRILMRRQQCRSPQILKCKRGADHLNEVNKSQNYGDSALGTSGEFGNNWKTGGVTGSPMQAAQSHRNLHERHNSNIGKGIYKQRSGYICQNILQGQSIVPQINKVNKQNHNQGENSENILQPRDEYRSRVSISSHSNGVTSQCAPGPQPNNVLKQTTCLSYTVKSHGVEEYQEEAQAHEFCEGKVRKSYDQLSRQSIIQVYNKNMNRDSQGRSSSIKKSLRAERYSKQFEINDSNCWNNPIPEQVSPKPITTSPNVFEFRENSNELQDKAGENLENIMSLEPRQLDQCRASITSPVKAFDYQSNDIMIRQSNELQLINLQSECQKAVMMVLQSNESRQVPFNNAPTPKPQDKLPTPFISQQTFMQQDQQASNDNILRQTSHVSSLLDNDDKQQFESFKATIQASEHIETSNQIQSQNFSKIKRQSALLHDRYANRSRRNQESKKQLQPLSQHSNSYEPYSDRLNNNAIKNQQDDIGNKYDQDKNVNQRSTSTLQNRDKVFNQTPNQSKSIGKNTLLHRPRHHDQNIGSHYKDRAKRIKELHMEFDQNGEITFKQNRSNNDISTISDIKYEVDNIKRQQTQAKAPPPHFETLGKIEPCEPQIISNRALNQARKSENVSIIYSQRQILTGSNQIQQKQEKEQKLISQIASLKQFKIDDSQSSSNFVREKRQYLVRSQLNEQAPETNQAVLPTYTPRNAQPQNILSEDSTHNELEDYAHHLTFSEKPATMGTGMKQRAVSQIMIFDKATEGDDWSNQDNKKIESTSTTTATTGNVVQKTERKTRKERAQRKAAGSNIKNGAAVAHSNNILDLTNKPEFQEQICTGLLRNSMNQNHMGLQENHREQVNKNMEKIEENEALLAQSSYNLREFAKNY